MDHDQYFLLFHTFNIVISISKSDCIRQGSINIEGPKRQNGFTKKTAATNYPFPTPPIPVHFVFGQNLNIKMVTLTLANRNIDVIFRKKSERVNYKNGLDKQILANENKGFP